MNKTVVTDLSGALAVGSIAFAGAFLVVDGINGLFILIEQYANTATWAAVIAAPTLVLAYVLGVVAIQLTSLLRTQYDISHGRDPVASFVQLAQLGSDDLISRYSELRRTQEFLQGMSPSLAFLGVGFFFSIRWMGEFYIFGYVAGVGCIGLGVMLPILAHRIALQAFRLAELAQPPAD